jgi:hypothetical protein
LRSAITGKIGSPVTIRQPQAAVEEEFQHLVDDYQFVFDKPALLQKLAKMCKSSDKQAIVDETITEMLYKMIVIEYREKKLWFDLHPAARRLYEQNAHIIDNALGTH